MKLFRLLLALSLVATLAVGAAAADPVAGDSEVGFLETGHDYLIQFSKNDNVFQKTTSGISATSYTTEDGKKHAGKPATWKVTMTVEVFKLVRFGGGSWVLLEHPASPDDAVKWNAKRRAMAQLTDAVVEQLNANAAGKEKLQELRQAAARDISTTKTWVNLDHAITIAEVPTEPADRKLVVTSVEIKNND